VAKKSFVCFGNNLIDDATREQFQSALDYEHAISGALMPDGHLGYTMPIGGVIGTRGYLVPSWVGYDIGCGVMGVQTTYDPKEIVEYADYIYETILDKVPVGFKHNEKPVGWHSYNTLPKTDWFHKMFRSAGGFKQLGTLGGGNHFMEIGVDTENIVWLLTHSGSRGVGHKTATEYIKRAHPDGKCKEGSYGFEVSTQNGRDYFADMNMCLAFALFNRMCIIERMQIAIDEIIDGGEVLPNTDINCNHNLAVYDKGYNLWIHRKGATVATSNTFGIIPGNMRDGSFVVRGLGNSDSLFSCSHGAGRTMSRKKAKKEIHIEKFVADMEGIYCEPRLATLDESPDAYKSVSEVMKAQEDLIEIVTWIKPLINVKG
jgi:tRNA-splicing ligase RtcB